VDRGGRLSAICILVERAAPRGCDPGLQPVWVSVQSPTSPPRYPRPIQAYGHRADPKTAARAPEFGGKGRAPERREPTRRFRLHRALSPKQRSGAAGPVQPSPDVFACWHTSPRRRPHRIFFFPSRGQGLPGSEYDAARRGYFPRGSLARGSPVARALLAGTRPPFALVAIRNACPGPYPNLPGQYRRMRPLYPAERHKSCRASFRVSGEGGSRR